MRDLVQHVVWEEEWMVPLLEGKTVAEVGDQLDGDRLGDDPVAAARSSSAAALASCDELLPANPTVPSRCWPLCHASTAPAPR